MKIAVGFSTTTLLVSRIIRWVTSSDISHSYIRFYDATLGVDIVCHADFPGVVIVPTSKFDSENIAIEEFEIDDARLNTSIRKNMRLIGKRYPRRKLIAWIPFVLFKKWLKRKVKNPLDDPDGLICVDFCLHILNDADITALPYDMLTPMDLRQWFRNNYEKFGWTRKVLDK
jgi:hypothetical protein